MTCLVTSSCRHALALLLLAAGITGSVQAQTGSSRAPGALNWKWMDEVTFDFKPRRSGTEAERTITGSIWAKELRSAVDPLSGERDPSFVLVGSAQHNGAHFFFSIYRSAKYACERPPNGSAGINHMYSRCPLRVTLVTADGRMLSQDFAGYCALNDDSVDIPRSRNHTEYTFDPRSGTAYFRVIQHGKVVPVCNRSVRIATR